MRGGELDAGERDLGGARGEPARVEHPLPHGHGHGHLHDHVRRDEWIPSPRSPEHPSRGVLELSTHPQLGEPPSRVACRPLAGVFVFFSFSTPPDGTMEGCGDWGAGGRLGITGAEDS